jgi:hypothetical protein
LARGWQGLDTRFVGSHDLVDNNSYFAGSENSVFSRKNDPVGKNRLRQAPTHARKECLAATVYRYQFWDGQECDVWDEAVYMFYQSFPEEQQSFRWNIRSSGIAHPNLLHPWMDKIEFPDPGERAYGPLVAPICYVPSHVYIPVSHLFNGQQPGNREILLLAESEVAFARLILDASSVPGIRLTRVRAFRGGRSGERQAIGSSEPRPGVFMCQGTYMKAGDTLRFVYDTEAR